MEDIENSINDESGGQFPLRVIATFWNIENSIGNFISLSLCLFRDNWIVPIPKKLNSEFPSVLNSHREVS